MSHDEIYDQDSSPGPTAAADLPGEPTAVSAYEQYMRVFDIKDALQRQQQHENESAAADSGEGNGKPVEGSTQSISGEEFFRDLFNREEFLFNGEEYFARWINDDPKEDKFLEGIARKARRIQEQHAQRLIEADERGDIDLDEIAHTWDASNGQSLVNAFRGVELPEVRPGCFKIEWIDETAEWPAPTSQRGTTGGAATGQSDAGGGDTGGLAQPE